MQERQEIYLRCKGVVVSGEVDVSDVMRKHQHKGAMLLQVVQFGHVNVVNIHSTEHLS